MKKVNTKALESLKYHGKKLRNSLVPIIAGAAIALGSAYVAKQAIGKYNEVFDVRDVYNGLSDKKETVGNICQYVIDAQNDLNGNSVSGNKYAYIRGAKNSIDNAINTIEKDEFDDDFEDEFLEMARDIRKSLDTTTSDDVKYARRNMGNLLGIANKEFNELDRAYKEMGADTSYMAPEISCLGFVASSIFSLAGGIFALYGVSSAVENTKKIGRSLKNLLSEKEIENKN